MPIFDTHAHYNDNAFRKDREELLSALPAAGVGAAVIPGVDAESSPLRPGPGGEPALAVRRRRHPPGGLRRLRGRGL